MKKKQTKIKARRMWANPQEMREYYMCLTSHCDPSVDRENTLPVAVIPLDDMDRMIGTAAAVALDTPGDTMTRIRAALVAIGVLPKARKGRK